MVAFEHTKTYPRNHWLPLSFISKTPRITAQQPPTIYALDSELLYAHPTQAAKKKRSLSAHSSLLSGSHFSGCTGRQVRTVLSGWFSVGSVFFWLTALPHKHQSYQKGDVRDAQPGGKTELNCPSGYPEHIFLSLKQLWNSSLPSHCASAEKGCALVAK